MIQPPPGKWPGGRGSLLRVTGRPRLSPACSSQSPMGSRHRGPGDQSCHPPKLPGGMRKNVIDCGPTNVTCIVLYAQLICIFPLTNIELPPCSLWNSAMTMRHIRRTKTFSRLQNHSDKMRETLFLLYCPQQFFIFITSLIFFLDCTLNCKFTFGI